MPVIKEVYGEKIELTEQFSENPLLVLSTAISVLLTVISAVYGLFVMDIFLSISAAWIGGTITMILFCASAIFPNDGYLVRSGHVSRYISKTTPEADQIAICNAAKEIEAELIDIQTREARLEEMARKCK